LFAVAIYHAFEQQVILFLRREILHPIEENDQKLFSMTEFQNRLKVHGINVQDLPPWKCVSELRLVANTVKHAEGQSAKQLQESRPDLFRHPRVMDIPFSNVTRRIFQPLVGEDLYVSLEDIRAYCNATIDFWKDLGEALRRA
jgi:hypothetical protein